MTPRIVGDIETFSRINLKKAGLAKYAEDESTALNCFCWKGPDGILHAWVPTASIEWVNLFIAYCIAEGHPWPGYVFIGMNAPQELLQHIESGLEFHAHNAAFERLVLNGPAGRKYKFPKLEISRMRCSMANCRVHGLPGALEDAADAVQALVRKRKKGQAAMRYLASPRKNGTQPTIEEEPERFMELVLYCGFDVGAEEAVDNLVPPMTAACQQIWQIDQEMNDRGWAADLESCDNMEILVSIYKKELDKRCREMTGIKPSRPGPLADWIRAHGFPELENLQADTVRKALTKDIPEDVKTVLKLYSTYNMKAVMKYPAIRVAACSDGRLRHLFMFYGAGTGRWSSVIVQLQNLFRPVIDNPEVAIDAARDWDLEWLRFVFAGTDPMKVIASCVRSVLISAPKKDLVFPDYAGVEARWNAWMFNESWKIESYRAYDSGQGPNLYCVVYGRCFGVEPTSREGLEGKQIGKVLDLSMGYEGGVGAYVKMAGTYRIDLRDMAERTYPTLARDVLEESVDAYHYAGEQGRHYELPEKIWITCEALKRLWRRAHPRIVAGWKQLKEAAIDAVDNPGNVYKIPNGRIMFKVEGNWLVMRLPSGRKLWYYKPQVHRPKPTKKQSRPQPILYYLGVDTKTRQWGRTSTYGGKICENETQGGCADLLIRAKHKLRAASFPLIASIHDQPVMEVDEDLECEKEIERLMCEGQTWDTGLPLAVEMHRGKRFRK